MKKYLSIGEVVKIKGVSHRALRLYDSMGILVPAYVNEESGYRYYSKNQMLLLDIIMLCVDFGIPLKQCKSYIMTDGSIDAHKVTEDALHKAYELQKTLDQKLYFLHSIKEHFGESANRVSLGQSYRKQIKKRYLLTTPAFENTGAWQEYTTNLTKLYALAQEHDFSMSVNQGSCIVMKNATMQMSYFVEIKEPEKPHCLLVEVPEAEFLCEFFQGDDFSTALAKYTSHELYLAGNPLIFNDVLERTIARKEIPFEVQLLEKRIE